MKKISKSQEVREVLTAIRLLMRSVVIDGPDGLSHEEVAKEIGHIRNEAEKHSFKLSDIIQAIRKGLKDAKKERNQPLSNAESAKIGLIMACFTDPGQNLKLLPEILGSITEDDDEPPNEISPVVTLRFYGGKISIFPMEDAPEMPHKVQHRYRPQI